MVIFSLKTEINTMNYIDMFVLVLLVYAVFKGFTKGLIMQVTLLVAILLGVFAALKLSGLGVDLLERMLHINPEFIYLVSVGVVFMLAFLLVNLAGRLTEKLAESIELSLVNRMLGVLFSLAKIILLLGILFAYADRIDGKIGILPEGTQERSLFFKPFSSVARAIFPMLSSQGSSADKPKLEQV